MIGNKKLVVCGLIAVMVGIATIVPLGLFLTTQLDREPQFDLKVGYAYIDNYWDNNTAKIEKNYGWVYSIVLESSPKYNLRQFPFNLFPYADGVSEYYTAEVSSDKGSLGNFSYAASQYTLDALKNGLRIQTNDLFLSKASQSYGAAGNLNGTTIGYIMGPAENLDTLLGKPDSLTLTIRREGWVVLKNNSTTIHLADSEVITEVKLQTYGDGFMYNNLFTKEQLSKINPVMPQYGGLL
jgi:hypothetical protein